LVSDVPKKTLFLSRNPRANAFWWHLAPSLDQQAMQIVGDVTVMNICKHPTYVTAAKLKKPKALNTLILMTWFPNIQMGI
jgi:hypothetical protein